MMASKPLTTKDLYQSAQIANVGKEHLSFSEFQSIQHELSFRDLKRQNEDLGFTSDFYWLKFPVSNTENQYKEVFFETARPITDLVELYLVNDQNEVQKLVSGDLLPFDQRNFKHRKSIFRLNLPPKTTYTAYLHLGSDGEVISLPLKLYTTADFVEATYREQVFYGLFYGILFLATVSYLFFFISLKEKTFLYYGFYTLFIGLLQFALDGFFFQYITSGGGWLNSRALISMALIANIFLGKYAEHFLHYKSNFKILPIIFRGIYLLLALFLVGIMFSDKILEISYPVANGLGLLTILMILGSVISLRFRGKKVDTFFTLGITFLVIGFVVFILNNFGVIPSNFVTANSTKIGTGLEIIFLSLSMINRIRNLRMEKEAMQNKALDHLREMNELKSHFMSNMSHELRTPLNAIMGVAEYMTHNNKDPKVIENFEVVRNAAVGLLSCVNDVLDFEKIQKGELVLAKEQFRIRQTLNQLIQNFSKQASDKGLSFTYEFEESLPDHAIGDSGRLNQIVNNLLSNAIKFTSTGNVKLEIGYTEKDSSLIITVKDTGVGIEQVKLESIFNSFSQAQIDDRRQFGGLGLGLSIVKELVSLHEGKIELDSTPQVGTKCKVTLPYKLLRVDSQPEEPLKSDYNLNGARVLIVEDNPINQMIIKKLLGSWENTYLDIANDGKQALDKLAADDFDIILMDLQMPVMDGYEATSQIRGGMVRQDIIHIPIIAVTADTMEKTKSKVISTGMNDYHSKPIDQRVLFEKMVTLLQAAENRENLQTA